jgi:hypothetical protein
MTRWLIRNAPRFHGKKKLPKKNPKKISKKVFQKNFPKKIFQKKFQKLKKFYAEGLVNPKVRA